MGLFDSLLGSVLGGGDKTQMLTNLAGSLIADHNSGQGLGGLLQQFESAGLGHLVQSWVGSGPNLPVSADQIQQVLGNQFVQQFAQQHGIDLSTASATIARVLPQLVDHVTPNGQVPVQGQVQSMLASLLGGGGVPPAAS
ncbi:MAG: YidB family protein [Chthoniobacter sp.]|uniref:YidB family protein n=1 Tax=Chthoniobacter sp. TaxID=2510640 RepID=UPI0032AD8424